MQQIESGQFHDADELLTKALDALEKTTSSSPEVASVDAAPLGRHISDVFRENMSRVPADIMAAMPEDGASEHDYYIYGLPKRNP